MSITCLCIMDAGGQRGVDCVMYGKATGWELTVSEQLNTRGCVRESRSEREDRLSWREMTQS